jgi:citrate lyase subunit beta/citryl-CoA lyase
VLFSGISYPFVPASRTERYRQAVAAGVNRVIIDLEDAVAPDDKDGSPEYLIAALKDGLKAPVQVRINADDSGFFDRDLAALAALSEAARSGLSGVVLR